MHGFGVPPGCLRLARPGDPKLQLPIRTGKAKYKTFTVIYYPFIESLQKNLRAGKISVFKFCNRGRSSVLPPAFVGRSRRPLRVYASFGNDWNPPGEIDAVLQEIYKRVQPVANALVAGLQTVFKYQREWVQRAWARTILAWAIGLGIFTALVNAWGVPQLNSRLPQVAQQAAAVLKRDVEVGRVLWLAPTGLIGLHPFGSVGPISVGPGPVEGSSATLDRVTIGVNALQSILRRRIVLTVKATGAEVHLKQGSNYSWFGFPDDTVPTSRNFLPGLEEEGKEENGKGKGGGSDGRRNGGGGSSSGRISRGGASSSRRGNIPKPSSVSAAPLRASISGSFPPQKNNGNSSVSSSESFLTSVANELLAWHAAKEEKAQAAIAAGSDNAQNSGNMPQKLVIMSTGSAAPSQGAAARSPTGAAETSPVVAGEMPESTSSTSSLAAAPSTNASPAAAATSKGWKSFFPFQNSRQSRNQVRSRKQQIESLNAFKLGTTPPASATNTSTSCPLPARLPPSSNATNTTTGNSDASSISHKNNITEASKLAEKMDREVKPLIADSSIQLSHTDTTVPVAKVVDTAASTSREDQTTATAAPTPTSVLTSSTDMASPKVVSNAVDSSLEVKETAELPLAPPLPSRLMGSDRVIAALNSIPEFKINIRTREPAVTDTSTTEAAVPFVEEVSIPLEPSTASLRLNSLEGVAVGSVAPPAAAVKSSGSLMHFQEAVIDQATVRRKGMFSVVV